MAETLLKGAALKALEAERRRNAQRFWEKKWAENEAKRRMGMEPKAE